jgi:hypothetical protein
MLYVFYMEVFGSYGIIPAESLSWNRNADLSRTSICKTRLYHTLSTMRENGQDLAVAIKDHCTAYFFALSNNQVDSTYLPVPSYVQGYCLSNLVGIERPEYSKNISVQDHRFNGSDTHTEVADVMNKWNEQSSVTSVVQIT